MGLSRVKILFEGGIKMELSMEERIARLEREVMKSKPKIVVFIEEKAKADRKAFAGKELDIVRKFEVLLEDSKEKINQFEIQYRPDNLNSTVVVYMLNGALQEVYMCEDSRYKSVSSEIGITEGCLRGIITDFYGLVKTWKNKLISGYKSN